MRSHPGIAVEDLSVDYDQWDIRVAALKKANFEFAGPGWIIVTGPNGSGKSTLLNAIAGQLKPTEGSVRVGGLDPARLSPRRRAALVSITRQRPEDGLVAGLTIDEHVRLFGVTLENVRQLTGGLDLEYIQRARNQPVETLSGGQRQLLALTLRLAIPAPIILLDEPLAALDPARVAAVLEILKRLSTSRTIIQITHDPDLLLPHATLELRLAAGVANTAPLRDAKVG